MEILGQPLQELLFLAPEILLAAAGLSLLALGAQGRGLSGREAALIAGASLTLAGWLVVRVQAALEGRDSLALLGGLFVLDGVSFLVQLLTLFAALVAVLLAVPDAAGVEEGRARTSRFPALLLLAAAGLLVLASGAGLLGLGLGLLVAAGLTLRIAPGPFRVRRKADARATTPVAAFLATALPATTFALLLRVLHAGPGSGGVRWQPVAAALAAAALAGGSLAALTRDNLRGRLAAGSIAHAGFLLTGLLVVGDRSGLAAVLFYLLAATSALLGAWSAEVLRERCKTARSARQATGAALLFLLAFAGLPLTGGFLGKLGLLAALFQGWPWLAVTGGLASVLVLAAALRRLATPGRGEAEAGLEAATPRAPAVVAVLVLCAVVTLALGLVAGPVLEWVKSLALAAGTSAGRGVSRGAADLPDPGTTGRSQSPVSPLLDSFSHDTECWSWLPELGRLPI